MTDNELIAEFMGKTVYPEEGKPRNGWKGEHRDYHFSDMLYSTSWDWLMPVVEKIENTLASGMSFNVAIDKADCEIGWTVRPTGTEPPRLIKTLKGEGDKITMVYKAVVEFIRWYNEQKQVTPKQS